MRFITLLAAAALLTACTEAEMAGLPSDAAITQRLSGSVLRVTEPARPQLGSYQMSFDPSGIAENTRGNRSIKGRWVVDKGRVCVNTATIRVAQCAQITKLTEREITFKRPRKGRDPQVLEGVFVKKGG